MFGACVYPDNDVLGILNLRVILEPLYIWWWDGEEVILFVLASKKPVI